MLPIIQKRKFKENKFNISNLLHSFSSDSDDSWSSSPKEPAKKEKRKALNISDFMSKRRSIIDEYVESKKKPQLPTSTPRISKAWRDVPLEISPIRGEDPNGNSSNAEGHKHRSNVSERPISPPAGFGDSIKISKAVKDSTVSGLPVNPSLVKASAHIIEKPTSAIRKVALKTTRDVSINTSPQEVDDKTPFKSLRRKTVSMCTSAYDPNRGLDPCTSTADYTRRWVSQSAFHLVAQSGSDVNISTGLMNQSRKKSRAKGNKSRKQVEILSVHRIVGNMVTATVSCQASPGKKISPESSQSKPKHLSDYAKFKRPATPPPIAKAKKRKQPVPGNRPNTRSRTKNQISLAQCGTGSTPSENENTGRDIPVRQEDLTEKRKGPQKKIAAPVSNPSLSKQQSKTRGKKLVKPSISEREDGGHDLPLNQANVEERETLRSTNLAVPLAKSTVSKARSKKVVEPVPSEVEHVEYDLPPSQEDFIEERQGPHKKIAAPKSNPSLSKKQPKTRGKKLVKPSISEREDEGHDLPLNQTNIEERETPQSTNLDVPSAKSIVSKAKTRGRKLVDPISENNNLGRDEPLAHAIIMDKRESPVKKFPVRKPNFASSNTKPNTGGKKVIRPLASESEDNSCELLSSEADVVPALVRDDKRGVTKVTAGTSKSTQPKETTKRKSSAKTKRKDPSRSNKMSKKLSKAELKEMLQFFEGKVEETVSSRGRKIQLRSHHEIDLSSYFSKTKRTRSRVSSNMSSCTKSGDTVSIASGSKAPLPSIEENEDFVFKKPEPVKKGYKTTRTRKVGSKIIPDPVPINVIPVSPVSIKVANDQSVSSKIIHDPQPNLVTSDFEDDSGHGSCNTEINYLYQPTKGTTKLAKGVNKSTTKAGCSLARFRPNTSSTSIATSTEPTNDDLPSSSKVRVLTNVLTPEHLPVNRILFGTDKENDAPDCRPINSILKRRPSIRFAAQTKSNDGHVQRSTKTPLSEKQQHSVVKGQSSISKRRHSASRLMYFPLASPGNAKNSFEWVWTGPNKYIQIAENIRTCQIAKLRQITYGNLEIGEKTTLPPNIPKKYAILYTVILGRADIFVHNRRHAVRAQCTFHVPQGAEYSIQNIGDEKLLLGFTKIYSQEQDSAT